MQISICMGNHTDEEDRKTSPSAGQHDVLQVAQKIFSSATATCSTTLNNSQLRDRAVSIADGRKSTVSVQISGSKEDVQSHTARIIPKGMADLAKST